MGKRPNDAVVIDRTSGIQNAVRSDSHVGIKDHIRKNHNPFAEHDASCQRRPGVNDGRELCSNALELVEYSFAHRTIANSKDNRPSTPQRSRICP